MSECESQIACDLEQFSQAICEFDQKNQPFNHYLELDVSPNEIEDVFVMEISKPKIETTPVTVHKQCDEISQFLEIQQFSTVQKGGYLHEGRREKVERYLNKKNRRVWKKKVSYLCRKDVADRRQRKNGKFIRENKQNKTSEGETFNLEAKQVKSVPPNINNEPKVNVTYQQFFST